MRGLAVGLLVTLIVGAPELFGGRPGWTVALIAVLAGAAAISAGTSVRRGVSSALVDSGPLLVVVAALAWTCVQCIPLPLSWAETFDPRGVEDVRRSAALLARPVPSWWTLSRSPWPTVEQVVVGFAITSAFAAAWWHALARRRDVVAKAIAASVVAMAIVSVAHQLLGATAIFGVFTPHMMGSIASPLVNENNLAGFLAMGVPLMLVLGVETQDRVARTAWWSGAIFSSGVCIFCISRSGLGGLAVGLCTLAALRIRARGSALNSRTAALGAAVLLVGIGLVAALVLDELSRDLGNTNLDKVRLALRGLDLVAQQPWLGIGRGGYSEAFVGLYGDTERVEQPESILVQWASEWGLPVTTLLVVVLGGAWARATGTRSSVRMGALAGIASIVAHDFLDFAMERVGVAVVAAALLATALAPASSTQKTRRIGRAFPLALGACAVLAGAMIGPGLGDRRVRELEAQLVARIGASTDADPRADALLVRAVELHPSEPTFPLLAAYLAIERDDPDAGRWLNRTMLLAPGWSAPHLLAASWLASHGAPRQAWLELREAERRWEGTGVEMECALAARPDGVDEALRLFAGQPTVLDRLANCPGLPAAIASRVDDSLLASPLTGPRVRIAWRANAAGDYASAIAVLEPVVSARDPQIVLTLAQTYVSAGRPQTAVALLDGGDVDPRLGAEGLRTLARAYADLGDAARMRATIDRVRGTAHGSASGIAETLVLLGALEHQLGNDGHALRAYERAARLDPAGAGLTEVARISEALGDRGRAYRAWVELCRTAGVGSDACASAERLRRGS